MSLSPEQLAAIRKTILVAESPPAGALWPNLLDALDDLEAARAEIYRLAAALAEERAKIAETPAATGVSGGANSSQTQSTRPQDLAEAERKGAERAWDEGSVAGWRDRTETLHAGWRGRPKPDGTPNPYRTDQVRGEQP